MDGKIVICAYRPKAGMEAALDELMRKHHSILQQENLVSTRTPVLMRAKDGTIIEVFEWRSADSIKEAHSNPVVLQMWEEYSRVCDYIPVGSVEESSSMFSEFSPFN